MSARFKVGDLVVRNPRARNGYWPYGDEVCRVVGHYPNHNEIIVVPVSSPLKRHDNSGWVADRFSHAEGFAARQARRNDPATSKAAAKVPRVTLAQKVLDLLARYPAGLTGEEIAGRLDARLNSVTPRFAQLRRLGLVEHGGHSRSGQIVWVHAGKAAA